MSNAYDRNGTPIRVTSNNQPRELLSWHELPAMERDDIDYLNSDEQSDPRFFRAYGEYWDMCEFLIVESEDLDSHWDGVSPQSHFSAMYVRLTPDSDFVIAGYGHW